MILDATLALQAAATCAALGVVMTTMESLWHWRRGDFGADGIWPWYILRTDHNPRAAALLTPVLDGTGLLALLVARLAAAVAVPASYGLGINAGPALAVVIGSQMLLTWRCRLGGEGGDQMTALMLIMALLPEVLPGRPVIATSAALFVGGQITLSYIASGGAKLFGPMWRRGEALGSIMAHFQFGNAWLAEQLRDRKRLCRVICLSVIAFQVSFPLFFVLPAPWAWAWLAGGIAFHVGIAFFMRLYLFVLTFLGTYPCLIYSREVLRHSLGL